MPRVLLVATVCVAGLVAGCGSSGKTHTTASRSATTTTTTTHGPAMATTGPVGTLGAGQLTATKGPVLFNIRVALVRFFTSRGFSGVVSHCRGINPSTASCDITGTNRTNQTSSAVLTLSVNQTTGVLRITRVRS